MNHKEAIFFMDVSWVGEQGITTRHIACSSHTGCVNKVSKDATWEIAERS